MNKIYCSCLNVEVRGLEKKTSKKGNVYFVLHCENEDGSAFSLFIANDIDVSSLKKGDHVDLCCIYTSGKYPKFECLSVVQYN